MGSHCFGRRSSLTAEQYEQMITLVEVELDVILEKIRERLELPIHKSQISNLLCKTEYNFKKIWSMPKNTIGRTSNRGENFGQSSYINCNSLVFLSLLSFVLINSYKYFLC